MVLLRKIVFYLFLTLYLVLCPLVILYALGYIFTPKADEGFVKTGLIHFETLPANASVTIARRRYTEKTPATIRNLLAGHYDVKVSMEGYRPWVRKVIVEPGKAASFEKILMVPQKPKTRVLSTGPFEDLWPLFGTRYLLLKGAGQVGGPHIFDWKNETVRPVFREGLPEASGALVRIFTVRGSSWVLLQVKVSGEMRFLGCPLDKESMDVEDLSGLFAGREPAEVLWEGDHPDCLFMLYGQDLARLDLEKKTIVRDFMKNVRGFGLWRGKVYALRNASIVRESFNAKPGDEDRVEEGIFLENLFPGGGRFKLDFISNNTLCFLGEKGELFSNALPYRFVDQGVRGYETDARGRKVALWQKERVGVLDFEKPARKKEFFERGPEIVWVLENGRDIRQVYFVCETAYVIFCDNDQVFLARLGERNVPAEKIVTVREGSGTFYAEKTGKFYYLDPLAGALMAVDILPEGFTFSGMISEFEKETPEVPK